MMLVILEMVCWNSLPLWMLLSTRCSRVEEVVYTLEGSIPLTGDLAILLDRVLELDVWKSGEHLVSLWGVWQAFVNGLSLLHLSMRCGFRGNRWLMVSSIASRRQRQHVVMSTNSSCSVLLTRLSRWHAICSLSPVYRGLYHRWKLQFLVVWVITFLPSVSLSTVHYFFV